MSKPDGFDLYDAVLASTSLTDPWQHEIGETPKYGPDYLVLERLLTVPVAAGETSESGRFAKAVDAWLAHELRRAGFGKDEVWPRATPPRVLPRDVAVLLEKLPKKLATELRDRIASIPSVAPVDAKVLGRAYDKQVDVCIARWDRGPELMISSKTQVKSFAKNLPNRFEEAYGDAGNLRSRYPLAAVGFFFVQRATVRVKEPDAFERAVDMVRKLRDGGDGNGYTATGLLLIDWDDSAGSAANVACEFGHVPDEVAAPQFFAALIEQLLAVTPIQHHVEVRSGFERRDVPVEEEDATTEDEEETA